MLTFYQYLEIGIFSAALAEGLGLWLFHAEGYNWKSFLCSYGLKSLRAVFVLAPVWMVLLPFSWWLYERRIFTVDISGLLGLFGLFILVDFFYYVRHWLMHRVRFFWLSHSVHHASPDLNLAAGSVTSWESATILCSCFFLFLPLFYLGLRPDLFFVMVYLNMALQTWFHNTWCPRLGWLEYVLNTPTHHRLHHSINPEFEGKNYGGLLIVFDRMFGTFEEAKEKVPLVYGVRERTNTYNPLIISSREWIRWALDLSRARSMTAFFKKIVSFDPV
jgi:sterol desaturase/sphingolipid hydroxylase (fatty acid hydroxylase superfamily)